MSEINFNSTSYATRLSEIESAIENPKNNKKVNDRLELINKENGFVRFLKIIVLPIARFFGADPFAHTRANKVATTLLSQYQKFEKELSTEDKARLSKIISILDNKTKGRYKTIMTVFVKLIPVTPQEPRHSDDTEKKTIPGKKIENPKSLTANPAPLLKGDIPPPPLLKGKIPPPPLLKSKKPSKTKVKIQPKPAEKAPSNTTGGDLFGELAAALQKKQEKKAEQKKTTDEAKKGPVKPVKPVDQSDINAVIKAGFKLKPTKKTPEVKEENKPTTIDFKAGLSKTGVDLTK